MTSVLAALAATASAQGDDGEGPDAPLAAESADTAPPRYHLFRPTPRDAMRELSTDRPDATESPLSVDPGHVQVESDVAAWHRTPVRDSRDDLVRVATSNVRIGFLPRADFQIVLQPVVIAWPDAVGMPRSRIVGFGDTTFRLKVNLTGNDGGPAVGLLPFVSVPTASRSALRAERTEFGLDVPFGFDLPGGFALGGQVQLAAVDGETHPYVPEAFVTVTVGHDLGGPVAGFVELASTATYEGSVEANLEVHGGLTFAVSRDVQLDLGLFGTVVGPGDAMLAFAGTTFRR